MMFDLETYGRAPVLSLLVFANPVTVATVLLWMLAVVATFLFAYS